MPAAKRIMLSVQATPDPAGIRTAEFRGAEHTVVPCVALVEGVLWPVNASAPELALAEEFGRFPDAWNGRPVVYEHPRVEGIPVSASSPDILEDNSFGQLFNTTLEGTKLKTELWIDKALVDNLSEEGQKTAEALMAGDTVVEVSTGLFMMAEASEGEFEGEHFETIWRNIVPDHLAVLAKGAVGACSVEDGCGAPRTNEGEQEYTPVMRAAQLNDDCGCESVVIDVDASGEDVDDAQKGLFQKLMEKGLDFLNIRDSSEGLSDGDIRAALNTALSEVEDRFAFIISVFRGNGDSGTFVYEVNFGEMLLERTFAINDGSVTIGADAVTVRPETKFVPVEVITDSEVNSTIQENAMNKEELVNGLIANEATQYTDDDKDWLNSLDEEQLTKMAPVAANAAGDDGDDGEEEELDEAAVAAAAAQAPVTTEAYLENAPEDVRQVLNAGLQLHSDRKTAIVTALKANARCAFTEEQLNAKPLEELEGIFALASNISFEGNGATLNNGVRHNADDDAPPEPLKVFELNPQQNADAS